MRGTFFGHAAWGIELGGRRLLVDPNPASEDAERALHEFAGAAELILVTHGASDHVGISFDLLRAHPHLRFVSEPAVAEHARRSGIADQRVIPTIWGWEHRFGALAVRALEARHLSRFETAPGVFASGLPLAFLLRCDDEPDVRLLHLGDTSVSGDLRVIGELYRPTVALLGIGAAPGYFAELMPREGAQAALWLGVDVALPMHFEADPSAADEFCEAVRWLPREISSWRLDPLDSFVFERETRTDVERRIAQKSSE
ncbi:MAG TPA: MBL fold metallo-hydrolase [Gaiellaceae bacterium]|nr:MBL fold metallo-hydrolase [Gaiellaceae bacterium]